MQPTGEFQPATPVAQKEKSNAGLVLAVVFLALCTLVLGGLYAYEKFIAKDDEAAIADAADQQTECAAKEEDEIDGVAKEEILGVATADTDLKVRSLVDDLYEAVTSKEWHVLPRVYGDFGPLLKIDDEGNFSNASKYYGVSGSGRGVTNADGDISLDKVFGEVFEKHDMKKVEDRPALVGGDSTYYENSDGLICSYSLYVAVGGDLNNSGVDVYCASKDWVSEEDKELMADLAKAYAKSEGEQIKYISASVKDIKKNGEYQNITVDVNDAVALFYRASAESEWKYFTMAQQALRCGDYNTEELRAAYKGESCYDDDQQYGSADSKVE